MKQILVSTAFAMAFAVTAVGCAGETAGPSETGTVSVNLIVGDTDVTAVAFEVECDSGLTLNGNFNVVDDRDPPVWATIMDLPVGICTVTLIAQDSTGATLCTASKNVEVLENQTVKVDLVLACTIDAEEALGNIDIDATFEIIEGNLCPRLHFLNAVPINVPTSGSEVTVLVSDGDGDTLTTALTATGGVFADASALLTTYFCDGAAGGQTISVTVTDGDTACDKSKSFDVVCPGVDPCEGVVCDDTGNQCTAAECVDGVCEVSNVQNGTVCTTAGGELTVNGDFEQGAGLPGWTLFCDAPGASCEATTAEAAAGLWSGNVAVQGGPADSLIKNANIGIGTVQPNSSCDVSFDLKGSTTDGGVVFVEFFSELSGGGTSSSVILLGPPTFPTDTWTNYSFTTPTGNDVSGGVTVQLKASCGAVANCVADAYFDNVSVNCGGSGGGAGSCQDGVCEPDDLCQGVDCDDQNECTIDTCAAGNCSNTPDTGASCDGGAGTCDGAGVCVPNAECAVSGDCPDDGNECTDPVCNAGVCETSNNTNACDGGAGTCDAGQCVPNALAIYAQDFEPPMDPAAGDALILDTAAEVPLGPWLFFANVFDGGGNLKFNFGPFGAPNASVSPSDTFISAVVTGEGDAPQGDQQLSVFSDYNCCDRDPITGLLRQGHGNGTDQVEISVFQELNPIPNSLIGQRLTFSFDAKAGNIELATTAVAYIQTLNPLAGFNQTNFVPIEMTNIPNTWNRYEAILDLTDPLLEGQILQIGFRSVASDFQGSGIFYDNIDASLTPAP